MVSGSTHPSSFGPVASPASSAGKYGYGTNIQGYAWYSSSQSGQVWNTTPGNNSTLVRYVSLGSTTMAKDNVIAVTTDGNLSISVSTDTQPTSYSYTTKYVNSTNYHYFVAGSGLSNTQEVYPNEHGVIVLPINAQYIIVTCQLTNLASSVSSGNLWFVSSKIFVSVELPEDQNEVAAIEEQTDTFMGTTGSDTVGSDAITDGMHTYEDLSLVQQVGTMLTQLQTAVTTTEEDGTVPFPGIQFSGFNIPAQTIDVWSFTPAATLQPTIRGIVTFVFCAVFLSHIIHLIQAIFGIYEYGVGAEDFGNDSYDMGPTPKRWKADYSVDEDLGF